MRISYDYGHLEGGQDGSANGIVYEYAEVRKYGSVAISALKAAGHECIDCTAPNGIRTLSESLQYRVNKANASGSQLHICFHINAFNTSAYGAEVEICGTGGQAEKYANVVLNEICALGFARRGVKTPSLYVTKNTSMPAILIEPFFCDNANDCKIYDANKLGNAIAKAVISIAGGSTPTPTTKHPIMGKAELTKEQIVKYILNNNPNPQIPVPIDEFVSYYFEEGEIENIRPDFAACQSILETGFFKFGNDVKPEQCNYSGIGSTADGVKGASFSDARTGIRAQIQHLKAYSSSEPLKQTCVDPRYNLITAKGFAPNVEDLSCKWSVQSDYGQKIIAIYEKIKSIKVDSIPIPTIRYQAQVENIGWQGWVKNGETAGTEGKSLRLESLAIDYQGSGSISVEGYIQNLGWQAIRHSGEIVGTVGEALRLEGIKISLDDKNYSVQYQVHVQDIGWMPWVSDGAVAGIIEKNKRIEAIRIKIANKL